MMNKFFFASAAAILSFICPSAKAQMEMTEEPHHRVVFNNEFIRITELKISLGDTTATHIHNKASAVIFLSASQCAIRNVGGKAVVTDVKPGFTVYRPYDEKPVNHVVWTGGADFHCLVVELMHKMPGTFPPIVAKEAKELWREKFMTAYRVELTAGGTISLPGGCQHVVIGVDGTVRAKEASFARGSFEVFTPGPATITAQGAAATCIVLQFSK